LSKVTQKKKTKAQDTTTTPSKSPKMDLKEAVLEGMKEKKALDITILDLKGIKNAVADYFILCSGNSDTQIDAISDSIEEQVHKTTSLHPLNREGRATKGWVLLDYVDVVAHVFKKDRREFYALEDLWGDAKITNVE